jgi:hypothetical protein
MSYILRRCETAGALIVTPVIDPLDRAILENKSLQVLTYCNLHFLIAWHFDLSLSSNSAVEEI